MVSRSEAEDVSMVWQKRIIKGMKGEWVIDLRLRVRFGLT